MRDIIISAIIGACAPFLPFWEWDGPSDMILGGIAIGWISLIALVATENKEDRIR